MRILALTRYSRLGASTRLRTLQYLPSLEAAGFRVEVAPFFDDDYLTDLYSGRRDPLGTLRYFTRRIQRLRNTGGFDLIWIEKEALPWFPWFLERSLLPRTTPYVVDYDDSVFHRYDLHRSRLIRSILGTKIDSVMAGAASVMVGNDYLADRARTAGARNIAHLPTVVDIDRYSLKSEGNQDAPVRIGWIGTPKTWTGSAEPVFKMIKPVLQEKGVVFCAIGAKLAHERADSLEVLPWSEDTEVAAIQKLDVGIMPLQDDPWTRGKCGYKLIQYMACGLPVIASPIGVNVKLVEHGKNGLLADTPDQWRNAIRLLTENAEQRTFMGREGRMLVEASYSLQSVSKRLAQILFDSVNN